MTDVDFILSLFLQINTYKFHKISLQLEELFCYIFFLSATHKLESWQTIVNPKENNVSTGLSRLSLTTRHSNLTLTNQEARFPANLFCCCDSHIY